jgi:LmbE family N-acetylglucosaminyl deacetylase
MEIIGEGTPEAAWAAWAAPAGWPELDLGGARRVVVAAPHPDDEVLGAGGLLALLTAAGVAIEIIAVTDGEASHPDAGLDPAELAERRTAETAAALGLLGVDALVIRLRVPDGGVAECEDEVAGALEARLGPDAWCLATWAGDGHPDHEATGRAAAASCAATGARLLELPVWTWHWAGPGDQRVPWHRARRVSLPAELTERKAAAIAAFRSQVEPVAPGPAGEPILPPHVVARFTRSFETVLA